MPHSGGGGSHGGGGHGGSHGGGSSTRTSHRYFPGSRRYRRRYRDGREEYFYSNSDPRKRNNLASLIMLILFGGFFFGIMGIGISTSLPKRLTEEYDWPNTRVIDNIDVISEEDEEELEEILEDYNDVTGICPIIYTMYDEDYVGYYADLESFAYQKYVMEYDDEQHYLIVYSIPQDQVEDFRSGSLRVPDYSWEIMQGNDTDPLFTEAVDDSIVEQVQENFENGARPGPVFKALFKELKKNAEKAFSNKFPISAILPFLFVGAFFMIPIVALIRTMIKERGVEYDEVPLTDEDVKSKSASPLGTVPMSPEALARTKSATKLVLICFGFIGLIPLFSGIMTLISGSMTGLFMVFFGIMWISILVISGISVSKRMDSLKSNDNPLTADYPKAEYPKADYPQANYPEQAPTPIQSTPIWQSGTSYHPEDDEDDLRRKGFE